MKEQWCRFILSEGLMPTVIARKLKNERNDNHLCSVIADILVNRGGVDQNNLPFQLDPEVITVSFNSDTDLINWLNEVVTVNRLNLIKMYSDDEDFASDVKAACRALISSCSLVSEEAKEKYLNSPNSVDNSRQIFRSADIINHKKDEFEKYLSRIGRSNNTQKSYISHINSAGKLIGIEHNLWAIEDACQIDEIISRLENNPDNFTDAFGNRVNTFNYINPLRRYAEFLNGGTLYPTRKMHSKEDIEYSEEENYPPHISEYKVGKYADVYLRQALQDNKVSPHEVECLFDITYCKIIFKIHGNKYPILAGRERPEKRYYKAPVFLQEKECYISSQWYEDQLPYLKKWLREHDIDV